MSSPEFPSDNPEESRNQILRNHRSLLLIGLQIRLQKFLKLSETRTTQLDDDPAFRYSDGARVYTLKHICEVLEALTDQERLMITIPKNSPSPLTQCFADWYPGVDDVSKEGVPVSIHTVPGLQIEAARVVPTYQSHIAIDVQNPNEPTELHAMVIDLYNAGLNIYPWPAKT